MINTISKRWGSVCHQCIGMGATDYMHRKVEINIQTRNFFTIYYVYYIPIIMNYEVVVIKNSRHCKNETKLNKGVIHKDPRFSQSYSMYLPILNLRFPICD